MRLQARPDASYFICNLSESARADRDANGAARLGPAATDPTRNGLIKVTSFYAIFNLIDFQAPFQQEKQQLWRIATFMPLDR